MPSPSNISPRLVNQSALAAYLGKSKGWLSTNLKDLQSKGFPEKLEHMGTYDLREIDAWIDSLNGGNVIKGDWKSARGAFK